MIWLLACPEPQPAGDSVAPLVPETVWVEFDDVGDGFEARCVSDPEVDAEPEWLIDGEPRELARDIDCDTAVACSLEGRLSEAYRPREQFDRVLRMQPVDDALLCVVACGVLADESVDVGWDEGAGPLLWPQRQGGERTCRAGDSSLIVDTPELDAVETVVLDGQVGEELGFSIAAGDLDLDGAVDIVVGVPKADAPTTYAGAVLVLPGALLGRPEIPEVATTRTLGLGTADYLGWSVEVHDGQVLAGAPGDSRLAHRGGSVQLLGEDEWVGDHVLGWAGTDVAFGAAGMLAGAYGADDDAGASYLIEQVGLDEPSLAGDPDSLLGLSVSWVGDLDGDGLDEWATGAPGAARVAVVGDEVTWIDGPADSYFGWDVAGVGDHDGDGLDDLLVAAPLTDQAFLGEVAYTIDARTVAPGGDTDGDGRPELLLGEPGTGTVWRLHSDGTEESWTAPDPTGSGSFGWAVRAIGDLDGDGTTELLVGDPFSDVGGEDAGRVWILLGD
ncbi:MAG: hypothetical protein GY913_20460 [Proteobacteria bacterium]|nr:hypothetical protein [Pseudomonadota bacterium]MCP4919281.1 hypothetical protein [Pseudomonadota bacterium]